MAKIEIGPTLGESFAFLREGWAAAPAPLVLAVLATAALQGEGLASPGPSALALGLNIATLVVGTLATGALYRTALLRDRPDDARLALGRGGLQWGAVEWRVLGANLLLFVLFLAVVFVIVFVWIAALALLFTTHAIDPAVVQNPQDPTAFLRLMSGPAGAVTLLVLGPGFAFLFYLAARLLLFPLGAADTGRFDMGRAWSLTTGATGAIIVTLLVIFVTELAASGVAWLTGAVVAMVLRSGNANLLGGIASAAAGAAVGYPLAAGLATHVYRAQRSDPGLADQFR